MTHFRANVPCGECRLCCRRNQAIMLLPAEGDDVAGYDHEIVELAPGLSGPILKRQPNGDCIYLRDDGCAIHDRAPVVCRVFDCRHWFLKFTRHERRQMVARGIAEQSIFDAGHARLDSLEV